MVGADVLFNGVGGNRLGVAAGGGCRGVTANARRNVIGVTVIVVTGSFPFGPGST